MQSHPFFVVFVQKLRAVGDASPYDADLDLCGVLASLVEGGGFLRSKRRREFVRSPWDCVVFTARINPAPYDATVDLLS